MISAVDHDGELRRGRAAIHFTSADAVRRPRSRVVCFVFVEDDVAAGEVEVSNAEARKLVFSEPFAREHAKSRGDSASHLGSRAGRGPHRDRGTSAP
jgi:hypothetical protein